RRYVAGVNQRDPQQVNRLAVALGALIEEAAASKQEFLVKAAERDGFLFANGIFKQSGTAAKSFAVTRGEDLGLIDERGRRLHLLANDSPSDAIAGAQELVESVCRTILSLTGGPAPGKAADLVDLAQATLTALEVTPVGGDDAKKGAALVRACLQQRDFVPHYARLAVGVAIAFAGFVAETYADMAVAKSRRTKDAGKAR
ncbi:MAG TPA: hypothetical protein VGD50_02035, partial [Candidatus Baltobacteraceae bacterium]